MIYLKYFKPFFDFIISFLSFLLLLPLFLIVWITLLFVNKGKPFFFQTRPGKNEKLFRVIKFKTMNDRKDKDGNLMPDEQRLTAIGKIIRKTSLDEIPQLINIMKGDMSLVGPRPLLVEYLSLYNENQKRRHQVKPGITGWAQVNGRNAINWEKKFDFDVWYVANVSFRLDLKIFFMTIKKVVKSEGINSKKSATMEKFNGSVLQK